MDGGVWLFLVRWGMGLALEPWLTGISGRNGRPSGLVILSKGELGGSLSLVEDGLADRPVW